MPKKNSLNNDQKTAMNKALRQKIHIAKEQLGLDDFVYRAMLKNITGKETTSGMSWKHLDTVMTHLKKSGFKEKRSVKNVKSTD